MKRLYLLILSLLGIWGLHTLKASNLWIIGDATPYSWSLEDASALLPLPEDESLFVGTIYLKSDSDFKFLTTTDWGAEEFGSKDGALIIDGKIDLAKGSYDTGYGKIRVPQAGNYFISVNTKSMIASIEKSPYQSSEIHHCSLFLVGDATPGNWNVNAGSPLYQDRENPFLYMTNVSLTRGDFKIAKTIKGGGSFDPYYYYMADPADKGKIIPGNTEDNKWHISSDGIYSVVVDLLHNSIAIEKIGSGNADDDLPQISENIHKYKAPLYWSVYEYCYELEKKGIKEQDMDISSAEWDKIIEWVASELRPYGYDMICTDGFIPMTANDGSAYMTHYGSVSLKNLVAKCKAKGLKLGIYDNPLWIHGNDNTKVPGSDFTLGALRHNGYSPIENPGADDKWFSWAVAENPGTREFIDGFFKYYSELGVNFIRMDFLSWYENGQDRGMGIVGKGYGRESYRRALLYIAESANKYGVFTSLVMPHMFEDAELESACGNMVRIVADTADGGWRHFSEADRGKVYPNWPACMNMFDGFTYWSHISGRDNVILDGDFTRLNKFTSDAAKESVISLQLMAGGPIAVADQYSTIGNNLRFYTNSELLELNSDRFVGKPLSDNLNDSDSRIWIGKLSSDDYVVAFFNRSALTKMPIQYSLSDLGIIGEYHARDLWKHADLGHLSEINTSINPLGCMVLKLSKNTLSTVSPQISDSSSEDDCSSPQFFTMDGVRINNPADGVYIEKQGGQVKKKLFIKQ